jgi:hypothetical protein
MLIVGEVQSDSDRRYRKPHAEIRAARLSTYAEENVKLYNSGMRSRCHEL